MDNYVPDLGHSHSQKKTKNERKHISQHEVYKHAIEDRKHRRVMRYKTKINRWQNAKNSLINWSLIICWYYETFKMIEVAIHRDYRPATISIHLRVARDGKGSEEKSRGHYNHFWPKNWNFSIKKKKGANLPNYFGTCNLRNRLAYPANRQNVLVQNPIWNTWPR